MEPKLIHLLPQGSGTLNVPSNPRIGLGHAYTAGDMFESWIYSRSAGAEIYDRKQYLDRKWRMVADYNKAPGGVQRFKYMVRR